MPLVLIPVTQFPETCLPEKLHPGPAAQSAEHSKLLQQSRMVSFCCFFFFYPMKDCVGRKHASFISGHTSRKSDLEILAQNLNLHVAEEKDCNSQ